MLSQVRSTLWRKGVGVLIVGIILVEPFMYV